MKKHVWHTRILAALMGLLLMATLAGCGNSASSGEAAASGKASGETTGAKPDKYVIGFAGALSGASAQDGEAGLDGVKLAIDVINKAGGIEGVPLDLIVSDDKGDPKEAAIVANKYVQDSNILAVVGHYNSSCTLAGAPIYNDAGLVEIAFGSTSPAVSEAGPFTFRTVPCDDIGARVSAAWAFENYDIGKAAIIYENNDYGYGVCTIFEEECKNAGVEVVSTDNFIPGETTDFTTMLTKIKDSGADVILLGTLYNETAMLCKQAENLDMDIPFVGVDALYNYPLIELGGDAVEGLTFAAFFSAESEDPVVQEFVKNYKEMYNGDTPSCYAAYAYDALSCIADAIRANGADRTAIKDYLTTMKDQPGVSGSNSFDENGDVIKSTIMVKVEDGNFVVF